MLLDILIIKPIASIFFKYLNDTVLYLNNKASTLRNKRSNFLYMTFQI